MRRKLQWIALCSLVLSCLPGPAVADGTIDTTNATIDSGTAPTKGTVLIDACAPPASPPAPPPLGSLPAQGTLTGSLPPLGDAGSGALGDFTADTDMTLPGGTYEYTSYFVTDGATITYTGGVTLRVQQDVFVTGRIETTADSAPIEIVASGLIGVSSLGGTPVTGIRTSGLESPITLDAGERIGVGTSIAGAKAVVVPAPGGTQSEVQTNSGSVTLRAHGTPISGNRAVDLQSSEIVAGSGAVTIGSADFVFLSLCSIGSAEAPLTIQSFGSFILTSDLLVEARNANVLVEAAEDIDLSFDTEIRATGGDMRVEAFGGDVKVQNGSRLIADDGSIVIVLPVATGELTIASSAAVLFTGESAAQSRGDGGISVIAHAGDVRLETLGATSEVSSLSATAGGGVRVEAAGSIELFGASEIAGDAAPTELRAHGGRVRGSGAVEFRSNASAVDLRAATDVDVRPAGGGLPAIRGDSIQLVSGAGISLDVNDATASAGALFMQATDTLMLAGLFSGATGLSIISDTGSIVAPGSTLITSDAVNGSSGDVLVESFGGVSERIDVSIATVRSADHATRSGNVSIVLHAAATAVESFVLPKNVTLKLNEKRPEKSSLKAVGFFDTGPDEATLEGPAGLTIGDLTVQADLVAKGRGFRVKNDQVTFQIKPNRSGSSRAKFKLLVKGGLDGKVSEDGPLTLRFTTASADGIGTVSLENGRYKLGKRRGTLSTPDVFPFKAKATHKGGGKDKLLILAGIATDGGTPPQAPDVTIRYAGGFTAVVPGNEFERRGESYVATSPASAPAVSKLVLDYLRERLQLKGKDLDLGARPAGPLPVTIEIELGDDMRAVRVRMAPAGKSLKY